MGIVGSTPVTDGHCTTSITPAGSDGFIIFVLGDRKCLVVWPMNYKSALEAARIEFNIPYTTQFYLKTDFNGQCVEVGEQAYNALWQLGHRVPTIYIEYTVLHQGPVPSRTISRSNRDSNHSPLLVYVKTLSGRTFAVDVPFPMTVEALKTEYGRLDGVPVDQQRMIHGGKQLEDGRRLSEYGITSGAWVDCVPGCEEVRVRLSLCPQWDFSMLYPLVKPSVADGRPNVEWRVSAKPSGELTDLSTNLKISYLFWEALSHPERPPTPPFHQASDQSFDPANPSLVPAGTVILPLESFLVHLDRALASLALHVSARNDFITYWLDHFVRIHDRGEEIAFRFLAQDDFAQAARLELMPKPDVVTRVFMLFGGVHSSDVSWQESRQRAEVVNWKEVVGVSLDAFDETRYRILEWGGMEVPGLGNKD